MNSTPAPRWGCPPSTADKVWMMEEGLIPRDEKLIERYYHQKKLARQSFYEEMKDVDGFTSPG